MHTLGVYWNRKEGGAMPRTKEKENYRARLKAVGLRHTLPRERIQIGRAHV